MCKNCKMAKAFAESLPEDTTNKDLLDILTILILNTVPDEHMADFLGELLTTLAVNVGAKRAIDVDTADRDTHALFNRILAKGH